jgi:transposase
LAFFSRIPRCVVGLEACATAHYWARELGALSRAIAAELAKRAIPTLRGGDWQSTTVMRLLRRLELR